MITEMRYPAAKMAAASTRLRLWGALFTRRETLPLLLLLLALSTVFLFANDRGLFYRTGHHGWNSAFYLAKASNLAPEHGLRIFSSRAPTADGTPVPRLYSRFPIGGYLLLKLAIAPFGDDFAAQIYAGRILFLLFFAGSALLAYRTLCRLSADRWIALTATLLAFSSYYLLYYNDMPATENGLSLFGVMLTFHGMALFEQEGRFRQLLVKTGAALLLGWHVYALLLPFIVFGLGRELFRTRAAMAGRSLGLIAQIRGLATTPLTSRYVWLGLVALLCGSAVLSFNLGNEYLAYEGQSSLLELPTVVSALKRLGADAEFAAGHSEILEWGNFLQGQLYRIGQKMLPFALTTIEGQGSGAVLGYQDTGAIIGALALALCGIGLIFARHKLLLATLTLAGICWMLPLRVNAAFHDFEAVFYVGIPLTAFALALLYIRRQAGRPFVTTLAAIALALFALSSAAMAGVGQDAKTDQAEKAMMADFAVIRDLVDGKVVYVDGEQVDRRFGGAPRASAYFLTNSVVDFEDSRWSHPSQAERDLVRNQLSDYIITLTRQEGAGAGLLTPDNTHIFLYDRDIYDGIYDEKRLGEPLLAADSADWKVYVLYDSIIYISSDCSGLENPFMLHLYPLDAGDLDGDSKEVGFNNRDFIFEQYAVRQDDRCVVSRPLPDYAVAIIRTGQYDAAGRLWWGEFPLRP